MKRHGLSRSMGVRSLIFCDRNIKYILELYFPKLSLILSKLFTLVFREI